MEFDVHARKATVPEEMRTQAVTKLSKLGKRAPVLERARVRLAEDPEAPGATRHVCDVTLEGHGHVLRAHAAASDLPVAVDLVVEKLEHQVERLKGKLVGRSHPRKSRLLSEA